MSCEHANCKSYYPPQQDSENERILKLADDSIQQAFGRLKLELDSFHAHYDSEKMQLSFEENSKHKKVLDKKVLHSVLQLSMEEPGSYTNDTRDRNRTIECG